jgi:hypothetical protein
MLFGNGSSAAGWNSAELGHKSSSSESGQGGRRWGGGAFPEMGGGG